MAVNQTAGGRSSGHPRHPEPARPTFRCPRCGRGSIGAYDPLNQRATTKTEAPEKRARMVCRPCWVDLRDSTTGAELDYLPPAEV